LLVSWQRPLNFLHFSFNFLLVVYDGFGRRRKLPRKWPDFLSWTGLVAPSILKFRVCRFSMLFMTHLRIIFSKNQSSNKISSRENLVYILISCDFAAQTGASIALSIFRFTLRYFSAKFYNTVAIVLSKNQQCTDFCCRVVWISSRRNLDAQSSDMHAQSQRMQTSNIILAAEVSVSAPIWLHQSSFTVCVPRRNHSVCIHTRCDSLVAVYSRNTSIDRWSRDLCSMATISDSSVRNTDRSFTHIIFLWLCYNTSVYVITCASLPMPA